MLPHTQEYAPKPIIADYAVWRIKPTRPDLNGHPLVYQSSALPRLSYVWHLDNPFGFRLSIHRGRTARRRRKEPFSRVGFLIRCTVNIALAQGAAQSTDDDRARFASDQTVSHSVASAKCRGGLG